MKKLGSIGQMKAVLVGLLTSRDEINTVAVDLKRAIDGLARLGYQDDEQIDWESEFGKAVTSAATRLRAKEAQEREVRALAPSGEVSPAPAKGGKKEPKVSLVHGHDVSHLPEVIQEWLQLPKWQRFGKRRSTTIEELASVNETTPKKLATMIKQYAGKAWWRKAA